ncbi:phage tail protein, partial [Streptomyces sp. NPDC002666]
QLVQDLASKYTAALNKIDEEIKKLQESNKGLIDKAKDAIVGVIKTINELKNLLLGILAKAAGAIMKIIKDPIGFLGNLVRAVGAGLNLFITNIAEHLKTGVVSWLLGTAVKAGLELPAKFDMKGIVQLIGSLLGLTWDSIKARVTRKGVPDEAMAAVETSVPVAKSIASEGPAGAVKEIQAEAGDLKATILEKLTSYLIPTVIIAGITWILSLLNPASAFIRAVKGIIDIVTFVVTQGAQIAEFVNSVLDAVVAIANGGQAGVPKMVEAALAASVPLLIGFLASLLGIGSLANKVKSVFNAVAKPVNRAIDRIVGFLAKSGKELWSKLKKKRGANNQAGQDGIDHRHSGTKERAALQAAEEVLASQFKKREIKHQITEVEKSHKIPLRLIITPRKGEGDEAYVQTSRTPTHLIPPTGCTLQDKRIVDDEIDNFGRNRLHEYKDAGTGVNRLIRRVSVEEDYDQSISSPAAFLERQRAMGRGRSTETPLRYRPHGRASAAVQDVRDMSRRRVTKSNWESFLMEMRNRLLVAFEKSGGWRRRAGPHPGQINVGELAITTGLPKAGPTYKRIAENPPQNPQLFMEAVLSLQHGQPTPSGLSDDELDRAASLARLSHIEAARGTGASVTESLANFLASQGALNWSDRYGIEQPMVEGGSGVTSRYVHDDLVANHGLRAPTVGQLGIRAQSDYPARASLAIDPDVFMERERELIKKYACWHIGNSGISGNDRAIRMFVRRELEKH